MCWPTAIRVDAAASAAALPVALAVLALVGTPGSVHAADVVVDNGTPLVVQSPTQVTADLLLVGNQNSNQSLIIQNGGQFRYLKGIVGLGTSGSFSNNNIISVTGAGSLLQNIDPSMLVAGPAFIVGNYGTGNQLSISNGGNVTISHVSGGSSPDDVVVGYQVGANNNMITITGAGSTLSTVGSTLYIGLNSNNNEMDISGGGLASSMNVRIGGGTGGSAFADSNVVLVDGAGSTWDISGTLRVGSSGTNSTLTISNGGVVQVAGNTFLGYDSTSTGNTIVITGAGSQLQAASVMIGRLGTDNTILVEQGGGLSATSITLANSGKLQIGSGAAAGTVSVSTNITGDSGSSVVFDHDQANYSFASVITGALNVLQSGPGETVLSGASSYTGTTTVNGGTLLVSGAIDSSATTVNSGGTLAGTGTVGDVTVNGGGRFVPGPLGAPGQISVNGTLTFNAGATYVVELAPTTAAKAVVSGAAALAGTVQAAFTPGAYAARGYDILQATTLGSTTFSGATSTLPGFAVSLGYTPTDVMLTFSAQLGLNAGTTLGRTQQAIANEINAFFNNGGALPANFVALFGLTGNNLNNALSQLAGEAATAAQQGAFQAMTGLLGLMTELAAPDGGGATVTGFAAEDEPLPPKLASAYAAVLKAPPARPLAFEQHWLVWGSAYGGANHLGGDPNVIGSHDSSARAGGLAAGADYQVSPFTLLGFAIAGGGTSWSLAQGLGGGSSDAFQVAVRGKTILGPAYLAGSLAFAEHWVSTDRTSFAFDHLTARFNAQSYGGRVEAGYRLASPLVAVTPYAAIQAQAFATPTYSESDPSGGGFGLTFASRTATDTRGEAGVRLDHAVAMDATSLLMLRAKLGYAHDWESDPTLTAAFQTLPGVSFVASGAAPPRDSGLVSAGGELRFASGLVIGARFDGEFASRSQSYAGTGTVRYTW